MSSSQSTLSTLVLSTPHLLAYCVPLLLISIPFTFAGTFLTLDRSRSFPSSYSPVPLPGAFDGPKKKRKLTFSLQGGVGGLASGYVFGLHLSTFLALLIPEVSSSSSLSPNSFLAVWILSCILTTVLGGRYRYCALFFSAASGGALSALAISLIIHPPLLPRQVLTILLSILSLIVIFLFTIPRLSNLLRPTLRAATASSGAFSLVLAIAVLAHIPAWANVWERLWLHDGDTWGTSKEKGLSAAYCVFLCFGIACDWALNRWLGECPDEKWDSYLAKYAANLPNDSSRAGMFKPFTSRSAWGRLFKSPSKKDKNDILFPLSPAVSQQQIRNSMSKDATDLLSDDGFSPDLIKKHFSDQAHHKIPTSPGFLKKSRSGAKYKAPRKTRNYKNVAPGRKPIKFGADLSSDSSDSDSDVPHRSDPQNVVRPWLKQKASVSSSSPTLVDEPTRGLPQDVYDLDTELGKLKKNRVKAEKGEALDYSDYEEDLGTPRKKGSAKDSDPGWSPGFMKRHNSSAGEAGLSVSGSTSGVSSTTVNGIRNVAGAMPLGAVPATPSLIKALDRISVAQQDAYGHGSISPAHTPIHGSQVDHLNMPRKAIKVDGMPKVEELNSDDDADERERERERQRRAPRWDEFWREVRQKAGS